MTFRSRLLTMLAASLATLVPVAAAAAESRTSYFDTSLITRSISGDLPNGPSRKPAISQDLRIGVVLTFESDASNLVADDSNGLTDIFVIRRKGPYGQDATPWEPGPTTLASRGLGGQPANGRSYGAAVDGEPHTTPRCVAFVSEASNLVSGDTNGKADAFVYWLADSRIQRVSVSSKGRQSSGTTSDVALDGRCERVAFTSDAADLGRDQPKINFRNLRARGGKTGLKQVFARVIRADRKTDKGLVGATFMASSTTSGKPGNSHSYDPSWSIKSGNLAFTSTASNLASGKDLNGVEDVYRRTLLRRFQRFGKSLRAPTLQGKVTLVSARSDGRAGNGPSRAPAYSDQGYFIAYETEASDLLAGDSNGVSDIAWADLRPARPAQKWASDGRSGIANGSSSNPQVSNGGWYIYFESDARNFETPLTTSGQWLPENDDRDVFLSSRVRDRTSLRSRSSDNQMLQLPSRDVMGSARGNYIFFATADPFTDLDFARSRHPEWLGAVDDVRGIAARTPSFEQIYMHYLGPKFIE